METKTHSAAAEKKGAKPNSQMNRNIKIMSKMKEVKIGNQIWMAENLNVEKFRNGDVILEAKTDEEWRMAGDNKLAAWCYYDNNNCGKYGKLYNWHAVNDPRSLAPEGWYIPTVTEWTVLIELLGGEEVAGKAMKSNSDWWKNGNGNNISGFNCLPAGSRFFIGKFFNSEANASFWSSTRVDDSLAWSYNCGYLNDSMIKSTSGIATGLSIRCLKI